MKSFLFRSPYAGFMTFPVINNAMKNECKSIEKPTVIFTN